MSSLHGLVQELGNRRFDVVNLWLRFIVFNSFSKLQRPDNKVPNEETEELADEEQKYGSHGLGFEKPRARVKTSPMKGTQASRASQMP